MGYAYSGASAQGCDYADFMGGLGIYPNSTLVYRVDYNDFSTTEGECMENSIYGPGFDGSGWNGVNASGNGVALTPYTGSGPVDITIVEVGNLGNVAAQTHIARDHSGYITGGLIEVNENLTDCGALQKALGHELGHLNGMDDMSGTTGGTVMNQLSDWTDSFGWVAGVPTPCDGYQGWYASTYDCPSGYWWPSCPEDWDYDWFGCCFSNDPPPPLMVIQFNGRAPMVQSHSVPFDYNGRGRVRPTHWPSPLSQSGFLVLDRNGNGVIDDGSEILGGTFPQRLRHCEWTAQNALAQFDRPQAGGNRDGRLDSRDTEFKKLMVWFDYNANGKVDHNTQELVPLEWVGLRAFLLEYQEVVKASISAKLAVAGTMYAETVDGKRVSVYAVSLKRGK